MKFLVAIFIFILILPLYSNGSDKKISHVPTQANIFYQKLVSQFKSYSHQPIVVIDPVQLRFNAMLQGVLPNIDADYEASGVLGAAYINEYLPFKAPNIIGYYMYRDVFNKSAVTSPLGYENSEHFFGLDQPEPFCALFPERRDLSSTDLTKKRIFYQKESYGSLFGFDVRPLLNRTEKLKTANYHELSHCIDKRYLKNFLTNSYSNFRVNRSKSELKAEILSVLFMTKFEGAKDLAQKLSLSRYLDSWFRGRFASLFGVGDYSEGGIHYAFGPSLENLQIRINDLGLKHIENLSITELVDFAEKHVEETVLTDLQANQLLEAYSNPGEYLAPNFNNADADKAFIRLYLDKVVKAFQVLSSGGQTEKQVRSAILNESPIYFGIVKEWRNILEDQEKKEIIHEIIGQFKLRMGSNKVTRAGLAKIYSQLYDIFDRGASSKNIDTSKESLKRLNLLDVAFKQFFSNLEV